MMHNNKNLDPPGKEYDVDGMVQRANEAPRLGSGVVRMAIHRMMSNRDDITIPAKTPPFRPIYPHVTSF